MHKESAVLFLQLIEEDHEQLRAGKELYELSNYASLEYGSEIVKLLHFYQFKTELSQFLCDNNIEDFTIDFKRWIVFQYHLGCIIQNCPIVLLPKNTGRSNVRNLNVISEHYYDPKHNQDWYKITLEITGKDNKVGGTFILNGVVREDPYPIS